MSLPFIEIIEWIEQRPDLLMWKFPDKDAGIKDGAQLTVRESETALLLNEGQLAGIFGPGLHKLGTENIPLLTRLKGWKYGFKSPFKADVYFFSTKQFVNLKWGTPAPVLMRDTQFGQVRVRAFGSYNVRITDVQQFFREYAGTYPALTVAALEIQLRDFIAPRFGEVLSQAGISVVDAAGNLQALNEKIRPLVQSYFDALGVTVTEFTISSVTLPEEVTQHYDKVTGMNMISDMDKFMQFNTANAIGEKGTAAGDAALQGAAMGIMMQAMQRSTGAEEDEVTVKLKKLKALFENGLIDEAEYKAQKAEWIEKL